MRELNNETKAIRNALVIGLMNRAGSRIAKEYKSRRTWTVTISAEDDLFFDVNAWLLTMETVESPRRSLAVTTHYSKLRVALDGEQSNEISVNGHSVLVRMSDADNPTISDSEIKRVIRPPKLIFTAKSRGGRDAVIEAIKNIHKEKQTRDRKPSLKMLGRWNDWVTRGDLPPRPLESVIVKGNVIEELCADLRDFKSREEEYNRRGIPYHRAYLLTGPPGTGKTSAVKAVAGALGLDLWFAPLGEMGKDAKLVDTLSSINPNSVLLLEDIDSFAAAVSRETTKDEISNSGLLNALDGVATPHGLVTIMTTNHPEKLDHALIRPGRIDRVFEFENPDSDTIHRHFEFFYGHPARHEAAWPEGISSAAVSEVFKRNMDNPHAAERELLENNEGCSNLRLRRDSGQYQQYRPLGNRTGA